jgi:6-phosphofructokinase 1
MAEQKRIGILTSGGDCPGLNAVIHATVKYAAKKGWIVYGIPNGTDGFMDLAEGICRPEELEIGEHSFDLPGQKGMNILLFLSGSVLGCRGKKKERPGERQKILEGYKQLGLDGLIVVGGDGSLEIIDELASEGGWKLVAIPKTIDNDVPGTERVVGFDTAVDIVTASLYNLSFTAASHDRVMIVQVMGRDAGHLALNAGIAGGADVILIPELTLNLNQQVIDNICHHIAYIRSQKRKFVLIVVAEGVKTAAGEKKKNIGDYLMEQIQGDRSHYCGLRDEDEVEMRVTVLGHLPRSSPPSSLDRLLAVQFGIKAMDLIAEGKFNQIVVWENGDVTSKPLAEVIEKIQQEKKKRQAEGNPPCASPISPNGSTVHTARTLGICLGDRQ